jgi:hypothetical protein
MGGFYINQFECSWRGNYLLEIGDRISFYNKALQICYSYILDDVITYNGALSQKTRWSYTEDNAETESNSTNLGESLRQTYARVDKANKTIELVASETAENTGNIANLMLDTESINAAVTRVEENTAASLEDINGSLETLTSQVAAQITADAVRLEISRELANGVESVRTATGYTLNEDGLTIEKTDSEMKTTISEDGMQVFRNEEAVLTANNVGVNATNLHATTYLIIGTNSRLEDYGSRTGCFWIGG